MNRIAQALEHAGGSHTLADIKAGVQSGMLRFALATSLIWITPVSQGVVNPSTGAAMPRGKASGFITPHVRIRFIKEMAILTMGLASSLSIWALAPQQVGGIGHGFKMGGIHTGGITAKMIYYQPLRDWANQMFVDQAMGIQQPCFSAAPDSEVPIPGIGLEFRPRPAVLFATHGLGQLSKELSFPVHAGKVA